jgi:GxxExxY protein
MDNIYRVDLIIENQIICELKSVKKLLPIHTAQLNSYIKLLNLSEHLTSIFEMVGLDEVFEMFKLELDALDSFN